MAVLQGERGHLVGEAELLGARPQRDNVGGRHARPHDRDRLVHVLAAADIGITLRAGRAADRERAVVAGPVAQMAVQDVEERRIPRADQPVGVDVRMRGAALAGDRVHTLHVLAAQVIQHLADQADALVLPHAGPQELIQLLIGRVDHGARLSEQRDLVWGLDPARLQEHLLAIDHVDALRPQGGQHGHLGHVDPERRTSQPALAQLGGDLGGDIRRDPRLRVERAPQRRDARSRAASRLAAGGLIQPRIVELVMAGGGTEIPHDGLGPAGQQSEADQLVYRPGAYVRRRHVTDVGEVEAQHRPQVGLLELGFQPGQPLAPQPGQVDALFPVDRVRPVRPNRHRRTSGPHRCAGHPAGSRIPRLPGWRLRRSTRS